MSVTNTVNLGKAQSKIRAAITMYGLTAAKKMEAQAKVKAPWEDRTSNARNSIQGNFEWQGSIARISVSGNMDYSVFLELAMAKKYAVLVPVVQSLSPEIISGYQKLVR